MVTSQATATNALESIACPKCLTQTSFRIAVKTWATLTDDGASDYTEPEWGDSASIACDNCGHWGTVAQFSVEFGDYLLTDQNVIDLLSCARLEIDYWGGNLIIDEDNSLCVVTESEDCPSDSVKGQQSLTVSFAAVRKAFNYLHGRRQLPEFIDRELERDDLGFDGTVGDLVIQQALYGEILFG